MSSSEQYDNIPWDLITGSFEEELTEQERLELESWLSADAANGQRYELLRKMWLERLRGYAYFEQTDKEAGWKELRQRMHASVVPPATVKALPVRWRKSLGKGLLAAAVIVTLIFVIQQWIGGMRTVRVYENMTGGPMHIKFSDGTLAILQPGGRMRMGKDYNTTSRMVEMDNGKVAFDVVQNRNVPFEVRAGNLSIKDIGTRFSIEQTKDSIFVAVITGKVACIKQTTGESHIIGGGMSIGYGRASGMFLPAVLSGNGGDGGGNLLQFKETPLPEVIHILEKATGKSIRLQDASLEKLRLTASLDGETYEDAIKIICTSLNLSYMEVSGGGILKKRTDQ